MKKIKFILLPVLFVLLITGYAQTTYLEEVGLAIAAGFDRVGEDKVRGTYVFHHFDPESERPVKVMTSIANTTKGVRQRINLESNKKIVSGQLRIVLFGEETAKNGLFSLIDSISRDPEIGSNLYILVTKGEANSLLSYEYQDIRNVGTFLYEMMEHNINGEQIISPTLHEFNNNYYSEYKDPIVPYLAREGEELKITGAAIFNRDKMVGTLSAQETFYIKIMRDRFKSGTFEVTVKKEEIQPFIKGKKVEKDVFFVFDNLASKTKIELKNRDIPEFEIKLEINSRMLELSEEFDLTADVLTRIEDEIEKIIAVEVENLMKKLQKHNSDPIGFGKVYNGAVRGSAISKEEWIEIYSKAKFDVKVNMRIHRTGMLQ